MDAVNHQPANWPLQRLDQGLVTGVGADCEVPPVREGMRACGHHPGTPSPKVRPQLIDGALEVVAGLRDGVAHSRDHFHAGLE